MRRPVIILAIFNQIRILSSSSVCGFALERKKFTVRGEEPIRLEEMSMAVIRWHAFGGSLALLDLSAFHIISIKKEDG